MAFCAYCGSDVAQVSYQQCASCAMPTNGAPPAARRTNTAGIVIGVIAGALLVLAIIGILAAIAIPNLLTAQQRSKQKRTMADIRSIATAIEAHRQAKGAYPVGGSLEEMRPALREYLDRLPVKDGWNNDITFASSASGYVLGSGGKDGELDRAPAEYTKGETEHFDCDIIFANGSFVQYPKGSGGR